MLVCVTADLGGHRLLRDERSDRDSQRGPRADGRLPETEGTAREGVQGAEDRRLVGKASQDHLLSARVVT